MQSKRASLTAAALSFLIFGLLVGIWHLATLPKAEVQGANDEYARLMGKGAKKADGFPTPGMLYETARKHLSDPFYDKGSNDKGIGIQLTHSLGRVGLGYLLA